MITKVLDWMADWLIHELTARAQLRLGVVLCLVTIPLYPYVFFSGEPPLIYLMSAAALTLTGIGIVLGAEVLEQTEDTGDDVDRLCERCGAETAGPESRGT